MVYNLTKELCNCCSRPINIGQPIAECSICDIIIHGKCFSASNFFYVQNMFICVSCNDAENVLKYNPFSSLDTGESTKFYDTDPSDVIDSTKQISAILDNCSLCSIQEVNKLFCSNTDRPTDKFSNFFLNIDGNKTNFDSLVSELETFTEKFSVIGLAETNIDPSLKSLYEISGYNSYYQSVSEGKSKGTGVALYIHESLNSELDQELSQISPNLECIFVKITNTVKPITIASIYRPHNGDKNKFIEELTRILENAPTHKTFLMGDFNMDLFTTDCPIIAEYEEVILTNGFSPLISTYTHQQPDCRKTCIDNILTNCFDDIQYTGSIIDKLSHHLPVFQISHLDSVDSKQKSEKHVLYYDFSNSNIESFVNELSTHDIFPTNINNSPNEDFTNFMSTFNTALDKTCKLARPKISKRTHRQNPWISPSIVNSVIKKHELRCEWSKTVTRKSPHGSPILYEKFSNYRRHLKKIIKWAKSNYYSKQFEKNSGDMKKTWQLINSIRGKSKRSIKPLFIIDNERIIDRRIIASKFNEYFISIATKMNNQAASDNTSIPVAELPQFNTFLRGSCTESVYYIKS